MQCWLPCNDCDDMSPYLYANLCKKIKWWSRLTPWSELGLNILPMQHLGWCMVLTILPHYNTTSEIGRDYPSDINTGLGWRNKTCMKPPTRYDEFVWNGYTPNFETIVVNRHPFSRTRLDTDTWLLLSNAFQLISALQQMAKPSGLVCYYSAAVPACYWCSPHVHQTH